MLRTVHGTLPWSDKTEWLMPEIDRNMDFPFRKGPVDLDAIMPMVTPLLTRTRTCIQAGGCVGVWPLRLAQMFESVITLEPEPVNFYCLKNNIGHVQNIRSIQAALWSTSTDHVRMALDEKYRNNCGAWFVKVREAGEIPTVRIDDMNATDVDLLCLDIEGAEYDALLGATDTLARYSPVIAMEDKAHNARFDRGSPVDLLCSMGYRVIGRPTPWDVVLAK